MTLNTQEASPAEHDVSVESELPGSSLSLEARHAKTLVSKPAPLPSLPPATLDKSILIDKAYDEYCLLREAGQSPDPDAFCERYPGLQASLRKLLEAHQFLEDNSQLLAEEAPPAWPALGDTFLGFELNRELGRGAFARVYLSDEPALGHRKVAVKIAYRGASEAETLGRLRHLNIVPVYSVQQDSSTGLTAVCMPYLGSATFTDVLDRIGEGERVPVNGSIFADIAREASLDCDLPSTSYASVTELGSRSYVQTVASMGAQIADALAFVHARGIFHRDLKPSNVLLGADGIPRLLDFNLSFDEETAQQRLGGTLPYMAPEQLKACDAGESPNPGLVGALADIFSLGLILYELLTGKHPFGPIPMTLKAHEVKNLLLARQQEGPRSLRQLNPKVGLQLATTIEHCLAFDPGQRPESAAKLACALKKSQTLLGKTIPWAKGHVKGLIAAGVVIVGGTIAAFTALPNSEPITRQRYEQGLAQLKRQDLTSAIASFDKALQADRNNAEALFARGLAHQRALDAISLKAAVEDFLAAYRISHDPRIASCMLYCLATQHNHNEAITWFAEIDQENVTPTDLNNYCCCLVHRHKKGDSQAATVHFRKALDMAPGFLTIVNNYQIADFRLAREEKRATIPPKPINLALELVEPKFEELR